MILRRTHKVCAATAKKSFVISKEEEEEEMKEKIESWCDYEQCFFCAKKILKKRERQNLPKYNNSIRLETFWERRSERRISCPWEEREREEMSKQQFMILKRGRPSPDDTAWRRLLLVIIINNHHRRSRPPQRRSHQTGFRAAKARWREPTGIRRRRWRRETWRERGILVGIKRERRGKNQRNCLSGNVSLPIISPRLSSLPSPLSSFRRELENTH